MLLFIYHAKDMNTNKKVHVSPYSWLADECQNIKSDTNTSAEKDLIGETQTLDDEQYIGKHGKIHEPQCECDDS